ncbi:MAG: hypothetical protein ABI137_00145 [Antricoccus sp.]
MTYQDPVSARPYEPDAQTEAQTEDDVDVSTVAITIARVAVWLAYAFAVINTVLLSLAFVLRLFGASTGASFTQWVYRNAQLAMRPFRGIFPPIQISQQSVLDTSLLFAALIYLLVAAALAGLLHWVNSKLRQSRARRARAMDRPVGTPPATTFPPQASTFPQASSFPPGRGFPPGTSFPPGTTFPPPPN